MFMVIFMKKNLKPLLKWAGGKTQILDKIEAMMPEKYNMYYEPFVGAGSVLFKIQPSKAIINDLNSQLLNIYNVAKNDHAKLYKAVKKLDDSEITLDFYKHIRSEFNKKIKSETSISTATKFIWLNKHCFNGLYRVNKHGHFNVPWNKKTTGDSIQYQNLVEINSYLNESSIEIRNVDFEEACFDVKKGDFVYFDSPYLPETKTADFTSYTKNGFNTDDHIRLADLYRRLDSLGAYVMLSNNDVPMVHELYKGFKIVEIDVRRSINSNAKKRKGKEVIIINY